MTILVKYIAQEFTKFFVLFLFAFVMIIVVGNLFSRLGNIFSSVDHFLLFLKETALLMPDLLELIIPVTILLATITTFNLLNRTSEIVAMRTTGMSVFQLAIPVLGVSTVIALLSYFNQNYVYNWMEKHWSLQKATQSLPPLWKIGKERIYYFGIRQFDESIGQIAIFNIENKPYRVTQRTTIETGKQKQGEWHFKNINHRDFLSEQSSFQQESERLERAQNFPTVSFEQSLNPRHQPLWSLYQTSFRLQEEGHDATRHWVEFHQKFAFPFTLLIMALLGLSLSLSHSRQGKAAEGMAMSSLFGILFWITNQIFLAIGNAGALSPFLAAWLTNFIFLGLALVLIRFYRP
ncbi:MAG: LptF/LptG family permease [SAR324 cluster bacterium]|nr:LptF/LptG family permease [SAR324 cluster bacterium]